MTAPADDRVTARVLGEFVVGERLGEGGFGAVYEAVQRGLGRPAVVKVLHAEAAARGEIGARLQREAQLAARLDHPYAAHVYASGVEPDGLVWIAMERVHGTPLDEVLRGGAIAPERFVPLFERLCEVVDAAHARGIIHRDVKPSNVMVVARGGRLWPKLLDFGVATVVTDEAADPDATGDDRDDAQAAVATSAGRVVGSPPYMAPEQWDAAGVGPWTDQYALGVLAFEALAGDRPFRAATVEALADAHRHASLPALPPHLPPAVHAVLARATAKAPADRFPDALALAAALRRAAGVDAGDDALPELSAATRAAWLERAPAPLAEAIAAVTAARSAVRLLDAIAAAGALLARWVGVVALACRSRLGRIDPVAEPEAASRVRALRDAGLGDAEWLVLAEALARPYATRQALWPVPELADPAGAAEARDAVAALVRAPRAAHDADAGRLVAARVAALERALAALAWVCDHELVVERWGAVEAWTGVARGGGRAVGSATATASATASGAAAASGAGGERVLLRDRDRAPVVALSPLVQLAEPAPGEAPELFVLAGPTPGGDAALVAPARGYERVDAAVWPWLADHVVAFDDAAVTRDDATVAPYPGLAAFTAAQRGSFVGREVEVTAIANRLRAHALVAVVGPSGVGKSSLLHAGVVPTLPVTWTPVALRPGRAPCAALAAAVAALDGGPPYRDAPGPAPGPAALAAALRGAAARRGGTLVVVVDQGEELFTMAPAAERDAFAAALAAATRAPDGRVRAVIALRDDFLCRADEVPAWQGRLAAAVVLVATPGPAALLRIVTEPARRAGYTFDDPALPGEMVDAVAGHAGSLPLLAFATARLWEARDRHFRRLCRRVHDELGGVSGALGRHAEAVLATLPPAEQRGVRRAFGRLLTTDGARADATRADVVEALGGGARGPALLERLVAERLVVVAQDAAGERVEVIHEALATAWSTLAAWRAEDRAGARLREQLTRAAHDWARRERPAGLLWRGDALAEVERWRRADDAPVGALEAEFVRASAAAARRSSRRGAAVAAVAAVALVVGVVVLARAERAARAGRAAAVARLAASLQERGRAALLADDAPRALVYLAEARRLGAAGRAVELMVARAAAPIEAAIATARVGAPQVTATPTADGRALVMVGADGAITGWDVTAGRATFRAAPGAEVEALAPLGAGAVAVLAGGRVAAWDDDGAARWMAATGHTGWWFHVAADPAGRLVATAGEDGQARLWDGATGAPRAALAHDGPVRALAVADGGARVVTGDDAGVVRVWDAATGAIVARCDAAAGRIAALALSPDGGRVAAASWDRTVAVCDAATGARLRRLDGHQDAVVSVVWADDGGRLVSASRDGTARVWAPGDDGAPVVVLDGHDGLLRVARLSRDGRRVVTAGVDRTARVWDAASGRPLATLAGHRTPVIEAVFVDDAGAQLASLGRDGVVQRWDLARAEAGAAASVHGERVADVAVSTDGRWLATASFDRTAAVLALPARREVARLRGHAAWLASVAFDPAGERVVTASDDGTARVWRVADGEPLAVLAGHGAPVNIAAFSPDGALVATGGDDGTARLWRADGAAVATLPVGAPVWRVAFDPAGRFVVVAGEGGAVVRWAIVDGGAGAATPLVGHHGRVMDVAVSGDGRWIASAGVDHVVRVWDGATGASRHALVGHDGTVQRLVFTGDGRLVSAADDGMILVWEVATGRRLGLLDSRGAFVWDVAVDRAGDLAVSTGLDGAVRVWDLRGYRLLAAPVAHVGGATRVALAPDGAVAFSAGLDGQLGAWDLRGDMRDAAALADLVRCRVPLRLVDDAAVPAESAAPAEPTGGGCP